MKDTFTIEDILLRFIGETQPYGETYIDEKRFENQELLINMSCILIDVLINNSKYHSRPEYSMSKIGKYAFEYLKELNSDLNELIE